MILEIGLGPNNVRQEVPNNNGRSDIEVLVGDSLVVFELKLARNKKRKSAKKAADAAKTALQKRPMIKWSIRAMAQAPCPIVSSTGMVWSWSCRLHRARSAIGATSIGCKSWGMARSNRLCSITPTSYSPAAITRRHHACATLAR